MKPHIGISEKKLTHVNDLLAAILSNEMVLYVKTRKFHWNVSGNSFMELHQLFRVQYEELEESIDLVAERISKLGFNAIGTMNEFSKQATLKESPGKYPNQKDMLKELLDDHETVIIRLRKDIDVCLNKYSDVGTTDFLTGLLEQHESTAWTLRRYLN